MSEKYLVVDQLKLTYEGLFDAHGVYKLIDGWFYEHGFDKNEKLNQEVITPNGKDIHLELRPWKKLTDYANKLINVRIYMKNIKEVEIERGKEKLKMNQGAVLIIFDATMQVDYEDKWDATPFLYFIRMMYDKYVYRRYMDQFEADLIDDLNRLYAQVKTYLNIYAK